LAQVFEEVDRTRREGGEEVNSQQTLAALNAEMLLNLSNEAAEDLLIQITGTFTGTLQTQITADGSTWVAVQMLPVDGSAGVTSVTAPGTWKVAALAGASAKVKMTAFTSGSAVVTVRSMRWT